MQTPPSHSYLEFSGRAAHCMGISHEFGIENLPLALALAREVRAKTFGAKV
jgi:hypothetical protein